MCSNNKHFIIINIFYKTIRNKKYLNLKLGFFGGFRLIGLVLYISRINYLRKNEAAGHMGEMDLGWSRTSVCSKRIDRGESESDGNNSSGI